MKKQNEDSNPKQKIEPPVNSDESQAKKVQETEKPPVKIQTNEEVKPAQDNKSEPKNQTPVVEKKEENKESSPKPAIDMGKLGMLAGLMNKPKEGTSEEKVKETVVEPKQENKEPENKKVEEPTEPKKENAGSNLALLQGLASAMKKKSEEPKSEKEVKQNNQNEDKNEKYENKSEDSSSSSNSSDDSNGEAGRIEINNVMGANQQFEEDKKWVENKTKEMSHIEKDKEIRGFFETPRSLFVNFTNIKTREKMFFSSILSERLLKNIDDEDFLKNLINTYRCPKKPKFNRPKKEFTRMGLSSLPRMEANLELFGNFYMQLIEILPNSLDTPFDIDDTRAKPMAFEIKKKLKKKFNEAKNIYRVLDNEFGTDFLELTKWQCDMKDYMNFHDLLPRFFRLYKEFIPDYGDQNKPFVKFTVDRFKEMLLNWKLDMKELFTHMEYINFILLFTRMIFFEMNLDDDPMSLIPMTKVFMNFYNIINFTISSIFLLKKKMFENYQKLLLHITSVEQFYNLGNVPDPDFEFNYRKKEVSRVGILFAMVSLFLFNWF